MLNHSVLTFAPQGAIRTSSRIPPVVWSAGVPFLQFKPGDTYLLAGVGVLGITGYHNGLPYAGEFLALGFTGPAADYIPGGLRLTNNGRIFSSQVAGNVPDYWHSGIPFKTNGALCLDVDEVAPLIGNVYPNPTLVGGSNIVADVFTTLPTSHVATTFGGVPCDATYLGAGNPAYTFVGTGNSRFGLSMNINTATNRGLTLPGGREYRFSAEVQMINSDGLATRLINLAAAAAGAVITQDGANVVPDGTWQFVYLDFALPDGSANIQTRHGMGMFNAVTPVGATQQTRNLSITDIGPHP